MSPSIAQNDYTHVSEWLGDDWVTTTDTVVAEVGKMMREIDRLHEVIDTKTNQVAYWKNEFQRVANIASAPRAAVEPSVEGAGIPIPAPSEPCDYCRMKDREWSIGCEVNKGNITAKQAAAIEAMDAQREDTLRQLHELANDRSGESTIALNAVILSGVTDGDQIPCVISDTALGRVPFVAISTDELAALRERSRLAHPSQETNG